MSFDAVNVKLGLVDAGDDAVFRLFDSNSLNMWAKSGNSMKLLKRGSVMMHLGVQEMPSGVSLDDFAVKLTFVDADGDKILLHSEVDLKNARREYVRTGKVKVLASVKPVAKEEVAFQPTNTAVEAVTAAANPEVGEKTVEKTVEGSVGSESPRVSVETQTPARPVLESVLGIVAATVQDQVREIKESAKAVKEQVKAEVASARSVVREVSSEVKTETASACSEARVEAGKLLSEIKAEADSVRSAISASTKKTTATTSREKSAGTPKKPDAPTPDATEKSQPKKEGEAGPLAREFIHGRHTCDGCLKTPIVGKRYHAVNMADYDLCDKCHGNYEGTEIQFEEAELDRDRPFQERWHRRFAKMGPHGRVRRMHRPHRGVPNHRHPGGPPFGPGRHNHGPPPNGPPNGHHRGPPPPHGPHHGPPPHGHSFGPPPHGHRFGPPPHGHHHHHGPPPPQGYGPSAPPPYMDAALKEAIKRSLEDCQTEVKNEVVKDTKEVETTNETTATSMDATTEDTNAAIVGETKPTAAVQGEEESPVVASRAKPDAPTNTEAASDNLANEKVDPEPSSSFADDAEGNGAVAAEIGAAFDKIAAVVDAMVEVDGAFDGASKLSFDSDDSDDESEVESKLAETDAEAGDTVLEVADHRVDETTAPSELKGDVVVETVTEEKMGNPSTPRDDLSESQKGAAITIVSGEDDVAAAEDAMEDIKSHDSWQVVAEDGQSEQMARLASALYNSDMARSNQSSSIASVPTTVPSLGGGGVQPVQYERWAEQLSRLSELGFEDRALIVDICERLQAANIGVGMTEEVTVEQIIDEMMRNHW